MTQAARETSDVPVWARPEAFPESPPGWGWLDPKGRRHSCDDAAALISAIRDDRDARVVLTWTPDHPRMILPEEVPGASDAVLAARKRFAADDLLDAQDKLRWFGFAFAGMVLYMFYQGWSSIPGDAETASRLGFALGTVVRSMSVGITLMFWLIFAFIPWYQSRKRLREIDHWTAGDVASVVPVLRFETWLHEQSAPVTRLLLGLIGLVGLAQMLPGDSLLAAGLIKPAYQHGQWWRLFTAPFLHGNLIHFLLNAAALLYLGKRVEVFARWPHVPLVFLLSACVGGEFSARFTAATTVGASGGLMGWLGFLLVFESLHSRLVPRSARRRLLAGVVLTAGIGLIGYKFIDNAAHAGGLLAGMLYAIIVFPKSATPYRPNTTISDRIAGGFAILLLTLAALLAVFVIVVFGR